MKKKSGKRGWIIVTTIAMLVLAAGLLYRPVMKHFILPYVHDKISQDTKKTSALAYDKNLKYLQDQLKNKYKVDGTKYNGETFSNDMDKYNFNQSLSNNGYWNNNGDNGGHNGPLDITYDYDAVQSVGSNDWNMVNPNYDPRLLTGHMAIPALGLDLPILEGVSNANLFAGACTMKPFQVMGQDNYALASHHMPDEYSLFSRIGNLTNGNRILLTNGRKVYTYQVTSVRVMPPRSSTVVDDVPGQKMVTLVTCTDIYATNRIVVQGKLTKVSGMHSEPAQYFR